MSIQQQAAQYLESKGFFYDADGNYHKDMTNGVSCTVSVDEHTVTIYYYKDGTEIRCETHPIECFPL
jgi:hypothetical protein